ncbi:MAG: hypothetical protein ACRDJV_08470 [Actinomycetota bacterium]
MRTRIQRALAAGVIAGLALIPAAPAAAATKTARPGVSGAAWYWEEQRQANVPNPGGGGDAFQGEFPNPFCPGAPGNVGAPEPTCKSGRLPVEVRGGDYKTPNMISAIAFDVTAAPLGSKVTKFTVTLKEATDNQSKPVNVEGHKVKACVIKEFFGDGEARLYKEAPKFACSGSDPVGVRKKVKPKKKGADPTFEWTFNLTKFAQSWVAKGAPATGVMLMPMAPKNPGANDNSWRVVFTGAANPKEHGVVTTLVYEPAALPDVLDFGDLGGGTGGAGSGGSTGFGGSGGSGLSGSSGSGGSASGGGSAAPASTDDAAASTAPSEPADEALASAEADQPPAPIRMPWYVWLGILAGIVGFTLVRNFVLESATGVRPNGVLAQIQQINARRRGMSISAAAATSSSPLAAMSAGLARIGDTVRTLAGRLGHLRK